MRITDFKASLVSLPSAVASSLCCVLPLAVVLLGLGTGSFMAVTMRYSYILVPVGASGLGLGYFFYFREKRRCEGAACKMAGKNLNLGILVFGTFVVALAVFFQLFPGFFAYLLTGVR
ncbi:MAG: hypothetical protein ACE5LX_04695 [Nitrospinota bacterium]